jgi:chromosome segregation ATPase
MSHHHYKHPDHRHDHKHHQMGALRQALENAGHAVQATEAALEKAKAELLAERLRRAQVAEQCERAIEALQFLRNENKRLRSLVAESSAQAANIPQAVISTPTPIETLRVNLDEIELCPTERVASRRS